MPHVRSACLGCDKLVLVHLVDLRLLEAEGVRNQGTTCSDDPT